MPPHNSSLFVPFLVQSGLKTRKHAWRGSPILVTLFIHVHTKIKRTHHHISNFRNFVTIRPLQINWSAGSSSKKTGSIRSRADINKTSEKNMDAKPIWWTQEIDPLGSPSQIHLNMQWYICMFACMYCRYACMRVCMIMLVCMHAMQRNATQRYVMLCMYDVGR